MLLPGSEMIQIRSDSSDPGLVLIQPPLHSARLQRNVEPSVFSAGSSVIPMQSEGEGT